MFADYCQFLKGKAQMTFQYQQRNTSKENIFPGKAVAVLFSGYIVMCNDKGISMKAPYRAKIFSHSQD